MVKKIFNKEPKRVPRYEMEMLSSRTSAGVVPIAFGVRDTKSGEIVDIHKLDSAHLQTLFPDATYYRARINEKGKLTSITGLDERGRKLGNAVPSSDIIKTVATKRESFADFDKFKNNPEISLVPLRSSKHFGRAYHLDQGFALRDDKTGEILRYIPEEDMRRSLASIDCAKMRVGKYGNVTSLDLKDGTRISEKEFIDEMLGVKRPERPYKRNKAVSIASVGLAAAFVITGVADGKVPEIKRDFNAVAPAVRYEVKIVKRNPGDDPMSSFRAIRDPELSATVENWFLDGTYRDLAITMNDDARRQIESDDPAEIAALNKDIKAIEHRMIWPVEAARAIDEMWGQDPDKFTALGYDTPTKLYMDAMKIAKVESYFGEVRFSNDSSAGGYYHMLDDTFIDTVKSYQREYGDIEGLPTARKDILALRDDPFFSTKMFAQHAKDIIESGVPQAHLYEGWVFGVGGRSNLIRHADESAAASMSAEAVEGNPSLTKGKTGRQTLAKTNGRAVAAEKQLQNDGFKTPVDGKGEPIIYRHKGGDDFRKASSVNGASFVTTQKVSFNDRTPSRELN